MIPTEQQNPEGLHQRYIVTKASGEPCDPNAVYFVLRLDGQGSDRQHIAACRKAAHMYCEYINGNNFAEHLWPLADDLQRLVNSLEISESI